MSQFADPVEAKAWSRFTHAICAACWSLLNPGRVPHRLVEPSSTRCCFCSEVSDSGIFVRMAPERVPCRGLHVPTLDVIPLNEGSAA